MQIIIRKSGNLIDVSPDGLSTLPVPIRRLLEPSLTYTYQQRLFGMDRLDPLTGINRPMRFETRRLYRYDEIGRLCCGAGLIPKLTELLKVSGHDVQLLSQDPEHPRPNRYDMDWDNVFEHFTFRPRQEDCLVQIASNPSGVIDAPTGFGKGTIIAMMCLLYPKATFHITTFRKDVVGKTVRYLTRYLPNVGQVGGGVKKYGDRVTVFTADSLRLSDGEADFLIVDEAHELMTSARSQELARFRYSRNFAFTATTEHRMDNADAKLESIFGPTIFKMPYQEAVALGLVVPIMVEWLDVKLDNNPCAGKADVQKKRWGLWRNFERNEIIANKARTFENEQVLILVETTEHAVNLKKLLPEFELCYAQMSPTEFGTYKRNGYLPPNEQPVTPQRRESMRQQFEAGTLRKVIATDVWSTGVDFAGLEVLIRADARSSAIMDTQAPGRVCRLNSGKPFGLVIDLLDQFDALFMRKAGVRMKNYKEHGWSQIKPGEKYCIRTSKT